MSQPNKNSPVDCPDAQCRLFEQQLDACLDGRASITALASDPHLGNCPDCRITFDIYRQFERADGAVLGGGARALTSNPRKSSPGRMQRWLPLTPVALAPLALVAAMLIYAVASPNGQPENQFADQFADQFAAIGGLSDVSSQATDGLSSNPPNLRPNLRPNSNSFTVSRSAGDNLDLQPVLQQFRAVGSASQRLFSRSVGASFAGKHGGGWESPWRYTSELPGIRPFHRSVNVALVLYNDSVTLL